MATVVVGTVVAAMVKREGGGEVMRLEINDEKYTSHVKRKEGTYSIMHANVNETFVRRRCILVGISVAFDLGHNCCKTQIFFTYFHRRSVRRTVASRKK